MPTPVAIIDTNVLVALIDDEDKWHATALSIRDALQVSAIRVVFMDCVINETISVIARRAEERKKTERFAPLLDRLLLAVPLDSVCWVGAEARRLFIEIVGLCRDTRGALNFHDALLAISAHELGIDYLVSFDRDFDALPWLTRVDTAVKASKISG